MVQPNKLCISQFQLFKYLCDINGVYYARRLEIVIEWHRDIRITHIVIGRYTIRNMCIVYTHPFNIHVIICWLCYRNMNFVHF